MERYGEYKKYSTKFGRFPLDPVILEEITSRLKAQAYLWANDKQDPSLREEADSLNGAIQFLESVEENMEDETLLYVDPHKAAEEYQPFRDQEGPVN